MNLILEELIKLKDLKVKEDLTISKLLFNNNDSLILFKNGKNTEISEESYPYNKIYYLIKGIAKIIINKKEYILKENDIIGINKDTLIGIESLEDLIYLELNLLGENNMNKKIEERILNINDLLDYEEGSIVNLNLSSTDSMMIALMAFDKDQGLKEHKAPGEALLTILEGTCLLGYEGKEYVLNKGDSFGFKKNGRHSLKAITKFKMMLILEKDN